MLICNRLLSPAHVGPFLSVPTLSSYNPLIGFHGQEVDLHEKSNVLARPTPTSPESEETRSREYEVDAQPASDKRHRQKTRRGNAAIASFLQRRVLPRGVPRATRIRVLVIMLRSEPAGPPLVSTAASASTSSYTSHRARGG